MKTQSAVLSQYRRYVKTRLNMLRITGLFMALVCLVFVALQFFNLYNTIWNCVTILYTCGFLFTVNGQYQDLCKTKVVGKISRAIALVFYLATAALLILILLDRFLVIQL